MSEATDKRRAALRERIVEAAARVVEAEGAGAVRARDLAAEAGCAVGALYNAVGDRNAILAHVNGRTFAALGAFVTERTADAPDPLARLQAAALAYLDFAEGHPRAWEALFDPALRGDDAVAEGYIGALDAAIGLIRAPLADLRPDLDAEEVAAMGGLLFSAVHGAVALSLEARLAAVPRGRLPQMLELLVRNVASRT